VIWRLLVPDGLAASVVSIDPDTLLDRGVRGVILDLDNTLVAWNRCEVGEPLREWLGRLRAAGVNACIVSNNTRSRVETFCAQVGLPAVARAKKPRRRGFRLAMELLGTRPHETAVVGDQVWTDVLGGKRLGLHTILVRPVARREFVGTRAMRLLEGLWLGLLRRRGIFPA
jgi:HAD superfamily phosphatase (TIGR01668 family)